MLLGLPGTRWVRSSIGISRMAGLSGGLVRNSSFVRMGAESGRCVVVATFVNRVAHPTRMGVLPGRGLARIWRANSGPMPAGSPMVIAIFMVEPARRGRARIVGWMLKRSNSKMCLGG